MQKNRVRKKWIQSRFPFTFVFFVSVLLVCLAVIFPVSALLNGTETLITTDTYKVLDYAPAISGDRVAWSTQDINDDPASGMSSRYIMTTNLTSGDQFIVPSPPATWNSAPSIDGDTIVWMQDPGYTIIAYDLATATQLAAIPVTPGDYYSDPKNNVLPKISGSSVVWQDYSNSNWDIFYYNLTWDPATPPEQIITGAEDQKNPAIYGDCIVYENWSGLFSSTIYLYNRSTGTSVRISPSDAEVTPSIDGTNIVWQNLSETGYKRIILYNISTGETRQISPPGSPFDRTNPKISGNYVVWEDTRDRNPYTDIYLYNPTDSSERLLTPGSPGDKSMPAVFDNRVVWQDTRAEFDGGNNEDIYLLTLGAAETCPGADFTADYFVDPPGGLVTFTDTSSAGTAPITYRLWNFSDGSAWENDPAPVTTHTHTFSQDGIYTVRMTAGNAKCRNISLADPAHTIFVNSPPIADFTATPPEGLSPLTVTFTDASPGAPTNLLWDFGDGSPVSAGNPVIHTFTETGKEYGVTLTAINGHGSSTATKNIRTLMGAHSAATTPIEGFSIDNRFGGQFLAYNTTMLPSFFPAVPTTSLISYPSLQYGWKNITFVTADSTGISSDPENSTFYGNISRFYLTSDDTIATTTGSIPRIGNNWSVRYQVNTTEYPVDASFQTDTREGASAYERAIFDDVASKVWPSGTLVRDIAYTATFTKQNFRNEGTCCINMSVAEDWVQGPASTVAEGRDYTYIMAYGSDSQGNTRGAILAKRYISTQNGLDYYEAEIPESAGPLSTFALVKLSGSGNVFQLVTLTLANIIGSPSEVSSSDTTENSIPGQGVTRNAISPEPRATPLTPSDSGKSAKIYANDKGVITQMTTLRSTDGLATVTVIEGVTAKGNDGKPLSNLSIKAVKPDSLQKMPDDPSFTIAGMAYDLQPDNTTFSPPISLSLSVPPVTGEQDFWIKTYDGTTREWHDVPSDYRPDSGIVTAQVSHLCIFALFSRAVTPVPSAAITEMPSEIPTREIAPPAPTAISIFSGVVIWVVETAIKNVVIVAGLVILVVAIILYGRKRRRDRIMFLL